MPGVYQPGWYNRDLVGRLLIRAALALCVCVSCACDRAPTPGTSTGAPADRGAPASGSTPATTPVEPPVGPPPSELATKLPGDAIRASLPPLPVQPAARPRDYVLAAYEFAALHPEVLKYVPCYCGCEQAGHQHNESCFVASRDAEGRVLAWDAHGMG
jgi:hypothetical protein